MTTTSHTMPVQSKQPIRTDRWLLRPKVRKATLVVHVASAGAWIGIDVIVGVLVFAGWFGGDTAVRGVAYEALALFVVWPMLVSGLTCLVSGLVLGLGTKWGLVRYWWVAVKLVLNVVLCTVIVLVLRPGMGEVRAYGHELSSGGNPAPETVSFLFFPPAVSLTVLTFATVLAVFKPWGRLRRGGTGRR
ncbi:MAG: hypothetical protein ACRDYU_08760 [Actinomycetes bacterium]